MGEYVDIYYKDGTRERIPTDLWEKEKEFTDWDHVEKIIEGEMEKYSVYRTHLIETIDEFRREIDELKGNDFSDEKYRNRAVELLNEHSENLKVLESMISTLQNEVSELRGRIVCLEERQNYIPYIPVPQPNSPWQSPFTWSDSSSGDTVPISVTTYMFTGGKNDE